MKLNIFRKLRQDQGIHQSFVVLAGHELIDGFLFLAVSQVASWTFALGAWGTSFIASLVVGHYAVEWHDKHDANAHREMAVIKEETWLYE